MDEREFKIQLAEAMGEPSAPAALVENTVNRAKTAERGRMADHRLHSGQAPPGERASLLADSLLGRMAREGTLPLGADTGALKDRLLQSERLQQLSHQEMRSASAPVQTQNKPPTPKPTAPKKRGPSL